MGQNYPYIQSFILLVSGFEVHYKIDEILHTDRSYSYETMTYYRKKLANALFGQKN